MLLFFVKEASAYGSAQVKGTKKLVKHAPSGKQNAAKKFLKKDHSDSNMMVAIRIRPLDNKEKANKEFEIIRAEDKLLVSYGNWWRSLEQLICLLSVLCRL